MCWFHSILSSPLQVGVRDPALIPELLGGTAGLRLASKTSLQRVEGFGEGYRTLRLSDLEQISIHKTGVLACSCRS